MFKSKKNTIAAYVFVFLFAFALYAPTLNYEFTHHDDVKLVQNLSPFYQQPYAVSSAFVNDVYFSTYSYIFYYRPMLSISFIVDYKIIKVLETFSVSVSQAGFAHFTNVIFHSVCSVLVLFFFRRYLSFDSGISLLAALLFAAHPIALQAVAWIPGRNDTLLLMFFIPCFAFFIEYLRTKNWHFLFFHVLFLMCCLFTKESAIAIVPLMLLYYLLNRDSFKKISSFVWVLWIVALAVFFIMRYSVSGQSNMLRFEGGVELFQGVLTLLDMVSAVIFVRAPVAEHAGLKIIILGILSLLIIVFTVFYRADKSAIKQNIFYIAAILMFFLPSIAVARIMFQGNRMYTCFFFVLILIFCFINRIKQKKIAIFAILFLIILSSCVTVKREYVYKDDLSMWNSVINEVSQSKLLPFLYYADALVRRSAFYDAMQVLSFIAKETEFNNVAVLSRIRQVYELQGDSEQALQITELINEKMPS